MKKTIRSSLLFSLALVMCVLAFTACSGGLARAAGIKADDQGLEYLKTRDKKGYVLDSTEDATANELIVTDFKGKPVTMLSAEISLSDYLFSGTVISLPDTLCRFAGTGAYHVVEHYINENGTDSIATALGKYAVYDSGSVYMGNAENPYLILVYTKNADYRTPEGTKLIAANAFSKYTRSIEISDEVVFIHNDAFSNISYGASTENGYVKELTRISIAANNEFYSTDGYHLYNKDQTRLIFFGSPTVKLPDSVIYIEQNAFSSDCFYASIPDSVFVEDGGNVYFPSESNDHFILKKASTSDIHEDTCIFAPYSGASLTEITLSDSVRQVMPYAFGMNQYTLERCTVNTDGWYQSSFYADGYAWEYGINFYVTKSKYVYAKMGRPDMITVELGEPEKAAKQMWYDIDWRRIVKE